MAIFKKQGVWWVDYYVGGRRKRERVGSSYKLAQEVLHKRKAEIAEGRYFPERRQKEPTFREFSEIFFDQHGKYLKSASDVTYRLEYFNNLFGNLPLSTITPLQIQELRNKLKETVSISRVNRFHTLLKTVFNKALAWRKFYGENPASVIKMAKEPPGRTRFLTELEIKALLEASHPRIYPLVACALTTGMRRGEILNLKWEDLNLDLGILYIRDSKSGKPREIPIIKQLHEVLIKLPRKTEKVFTVPKITLVRYFQKALDKAELQDFRFHDLRHTFASHFIMKTRDLPALQKILGHYSPVMTQRYAHLSNGHVRTEMEILSAVWTPIWTPAEKSVPCESQKSFVK